MKNSVRILWGFIFGIFVQTMMIYLAQMMNCRRPVLWALGASFLLVVAVVSGMWIIGTEFKETVEEREKAKKAAERRAIGNY